MLIFVLFTEAAKVIKTLNLKSKHYLNCTRLCLFFLVHAFDIFRFHLYLFIYKKICLWCGISLYNINMILTPSSSSWLYCFDPTFVFYMPWRTRDRIYILIQVTNFAYKMCVRFSVALFNDDISHAINFVQLQVFLISQVQKGHKGQGY